MARPVRTSRQTIQALYSCSLTFTCCLGLVLSIYLCEFAAQNCIWCQNPVAKLAAKTVYFQDGTMVEADVGVMLQLQESTNTFIKLL